MTTITHIAIGAVIAKAALTGYKIPADPALVYAISIFFSNIPDIDIPLYGLKRAVKLNWNHRIHSCLHFPLFWAFLFLLYLISIPVTIRRSIESYEIIALLSLGFHFLMDSIGVDRGICWFGPFVKKELSFIRLITKPETFGVYLLTYCKSTVFKIELFLWFGSLIYLFAHIHH